jgi:hypothetical protein
MLACILPVGKPHVIKTMVVGETLYGKGFNFPQAKILKLCLTPQAPNAAKLALTLKAAARKDGISGRPVCFPDFETSTVITSCQL